MISDLILTADSAGLHSCCIAADAMVGMNALVIENVTIAEDGIAAVSTFTKADVIDVLRSLVAGISARVIREVSELGIPFTQLPQGGGDDRVIWGRTDSNRLLGEAMKE